MTSNLSIGQGFNDSFPPTSQIPLDCVNASIIRGLGKMQYNDITIAGTGGEVILNVFSFNGPIELIQLWATFQDVTDVTTLSGLWFDVYDGTVSDAITADGVDCSGATVGSTLVKDDSDSAAITYLNANQIRYNESGSFFRDWKGGMISAKNGATNYLRLRADTDANTDVTIRVFLAYSYRDYGVDVSVV